MTPAADHRQKKLCCPGANDLGNRPHLASDMGMFFLSKQDMKATDIFPKDMPDKICANFTCKDQECTLIIAPLVTQRIRMSSNPI
jgi:hypothetical protein